MGLKSYQAGQKGEEIAAEYLSQLGYKILERNFHSQQGEIDIIALDGECLVFVEVKNYSYKCYGAPVGAVRKAKRSSLIHAANTYLYKNNLKNVLCRFDVLTIFRRTDAQMIFELYKDAFHVS